MFLNSKPTGDKNKVAGEQSTYLVFKLCICGELSRVASGVCCVNTIATSRASSRAQVALQPRRVGSEHDKPNELKVNSAAVL